MGIAFAVLRLVTQQIQAIQGSYKRDTALALCRQRLVLDFDTATSIQWDEYSQELQLYNGQEIINYEFSEQWIIRDLDTTSLGVVNKQLYYKGIPVQEGLVDGLQLSIQISGKTQTLFVQRTAAAGEQLKDVWE